MKPENIPLTLETNAEISALIEVLHKTGHRLDKLTAGQVDSVTDRQGHIFLLHRAQEQLRVVETTRQAAILNALPAIIALLDTRGFIVSVNEAWRQFGVSNPAHTSGHEVGGNYLTTCIPGQSDDAAGAFAMAAGIRSVLSGEHASFSIEYPCNTPTSQQWFLMTVTPLNTDRPDGAVVVLLDITGEKRAKEALRELVLQAEHSAEHDFLTGLPNRILLNGRASQAIALAKRHGRQVGVLFLDLDGFKQINDSLGHAVGDQLLQSVAERLRTCGRDSDTVSRQGGDEFVVLLSDMQQAEDAAICARRILHALAQTHSIDQHELHITASIGVSVYPDDGLDATTLIKNADTAMYRAKESGRQCYRFFKPAMNSRAAERQFIETSMRHALARREFALHYQPKVNLQTGAINGAEALLRWNHPARGSMLPPQFIPLAEDCGLIVPIGLWVLREACEQARFWAEAGLAPITMAVNVSAMQLRDANFVEDVLAILTETRFDPNSLEFELTESVLMAHAESTASTLQILRGKGIKIVIDDFGTGYTSLSYLQKYPIDALKIDESFIRQITAAPDKMSIVNAVIGMGRSLKVPVVAEGVETQAELEFLETHHCDEGQGHYFSRPIPASQFACLLKTGIPMRGLSTC